MSSGSRAGKNYARRLSPGPVQSQQPTVWLPKIPSDATDAVMGYPRAGMIDLLKLLGAWLAGLLRSHAAGKLNWRLSASNLLC
jgi:hypothetical protein